ncbi:carbon-nitrogen hydrolase family protein [Vibrio sp. RE88]|uniref:carbon-nitrogen hydrolase family protein n=1 Tax=Vibrio sp. RE88 TaxID=2607610 RepID=UPI0014935A21|nr:carbon-nitrogen hydrolase family protein [Vibrio sp. RE88]NOH60739.1 carbon-nitrogen hydrolase family protein [Vibrio sp. RE88]
MEQTLIIGLAQAPAKRGDIEANLRAHLMHVEQSSQLRANLVVFPELSLTGYELDLADELAFDPSTSAIKALSASATTHNITVIAGCPLAVPDSKPHIAAVICFPNGEIEFYSKQYLHDGEGTYCAAGETNHLLNINNTRIALAVCADFAKPQHAQGAADSEAELYLVSALISPSGFIPDANILSGLARNHAFPVLLCNHISKTGGWDTCGKNSVWNAQGELVGTSDNAQQGVLICTISKNHLSAQFHSLPETGY